MQAPFFVGKTGEIRRKDVIALVLIAVSLAVLFRLIKPREALKEIASVIGLSVVLICLASMVQSLWAGASFWVRTVCFVVGAFVSFVAIRKLAA